MMSKKGYIVAELPKSISDKVYQLRKTYDPVTAKLPVEITLAGSSGVGPIIEAKQIKIATRVLEEVAKKITPFECKFSKMARFPNTDIFYLELENRIPFESLHNQFKKSEIKFASNPFEYTPHCTIRAVGPISEADERNIWTEIVPMEPFLISTLSLYELVTDNNNKFVSCDLMHSINLVNNIES